MRACRRTLRSDFEAVTVVAIPLQGPATEKVLKYRAARQGWNTVPKNYWMVVQTPENHEITRDLGFTVHGVRYRHRRRAQRMEPDDRVLFYVNGLRKWTAIASITSRYYEDRRLIWQSIGRRREHFPFRVKMSPHIVLEEEDYIDALALAPRLEYLKRWPPERWPLAFMDSLHLLPQRDFRLIEGEMKRLRKERRRKEKLDRQEAEGDHTTAEASALSPEEADIDHTPAEASVPSSEDTESDHTPAEASAPTAEEADTDHTPAEASVPSPQEAESDHTFAEASVPPTEEAESHHTPAEASVPSQEETESDHTPAEASAPTAEEADTDHTPAEASVPSQQETESDRTPGQASPPAMEEAESDHNPTEAAAPSPEGAESDLTPTEERG